MKSNDKLIIKDSKEEVTGLQKAAMLMVALNVEAASAVLKHMDPADVEMICAAAIATPEAALARPAIGVPFHRHRRRQ